MRCNFQQIRGVGAEMTQSERGVVEQGIRNLKGITLVRHTNLRPITRNATRSGRIRGLEVSSILAHGMQYISSTARLKNCELGVVEGGFSGALEWTHLVSQAHSLSPMRLSLQQIAQSRNRFTSHFSPNTRTVSNLSHRTLRHPQICLLSSRRACPTTVNAIRLTGPNSASS